MKPSYKTTEFWITLATSITGILVALGIITPDQSSTIVSGIGQIVGAVIAGLVSFGYIQGRQQLKEQVVGQIGQLVAPLVREPLSTADAKAMIAAATADNPEGPAPTRADVEYERCTSAVYTFNQAISDSGV